MNDEDAYRELQARREREWEAACFNCGACCGVFDNDPCENLDRRDDGKYFCRIYTTRLGLRRTKSGREFLCVPLRQIIHKSWPGDRFCAYKRKIGLQCKVYGVQEK